MDEIKSKVLKLVKKQNTQPSLSKESTSLERGENEIRSEWLRSKRDVDEKLDESHTIEDEKVLENINPVYFCIEDVDIKHYQLKKLPEVLDCNEIKKDLKMLYRQHTVVSKKVLQLILEQENKCKEEFEEIMKIEKEVSAALSVCRSGRLHLQNASKQFTVASLRILANYKTKQTILDLLKSLKSVKTLQQTDNRLHELLAEGNFPGAISLLQECQLVAANFNHFKCVAQLHAKLNDTLYLTKEQLDIALSRICRKFNEETYSKLQEAYRLLDDTETVMDQLLMHFTSEIHNVVFNTVHTHSDSNPNLKLQFQHLCKNVSAASFIPCLQALCQNLWHIINSYYHVVQWHHRYNKNLTKTGIPSKDVKISLNKQHIKQKLDNGLTRLWTDVQSRVCIYLSSHNLANYKFEELLQILSIVHKLIEIGEEFCSSKSEDLQNSIRQQSVNYFKNYHHMKLEELRIFLENESWTLCPVKSKFNLLHLQEFKVLRNAIENYRKQKAVDRKENQPPAENYNSSNTSVDGSSTLNYNYFVKFQDLDGTPFDLNLEETLDEDILVDIGDEISGYFTESSDDSESDELKKDFVEEAPVHNDKSMFKKRSTKHDFKVSKEICPMLANTTLTVLRHCGKYLQMCRLLKPIALDVIICMCQLFDYYFYSVYLFFAKDLPVQSTSMFSFKLLTTIKRIEENLILNVNNESEICKGKIVTSSISSLVNLNNSETLYGLSERIIGVESLIFLGSQFEYIQQYLLHLIPDQKRHFLQHFYSQTITCVADLRRPTYMCVSGQVVDMKYIIKEMSKVNFEVKDVMSQHSPYVDKVLRELQIFSMRLEEIEIFIPQDVYNVLWENIIHIINNTFVEGFSNVKKCSNGGRALMQLDYTQFLSKLEKITTLRPIPNREYVDLYVKAYYLQESNLEEWINQHKEYTVKQLEALVHCACQNNRKRKQKLLMLLEGNDK